MRPDDLSLFRSPLLPDEKLRFEGTLDGEHLAEGLLCAGKHVVGYVEDGIMSLVAPDYGARVGWRDDEIEWAQNDHLVERSWDGVRGRELPPLFEQFLARFRDSPAVLAEVGIGALGLTPRILLREPESRIIINDISLRMLYLQREQMRREGVGSAVVAAAYDATTNSLRPGSVQFACTHAALENIREADAAIEALRDALAPGGILYLAESDFDSDEYRALPEDIVQRFKVSEGWRHRLERCGFAVEASNSFKGKVIDNPERGPFEKAVIERGITIHDCWVVIIARKPG